jgi:hypothetical protein
MDRGEIVKRWEDDAKKALVGKKIVSVRYLSDAEVENLGWYSKALVIQFDDGSIIFPSADDEGNNAGAIFGQTADGGDLTFPVI